MNWLNPLNPDSNQQDSERKALVENLKDRVENNVAAKIAANGNEVFLIEGIIGDEKGEQSGLRTGNEILKNNKKISWSFSNIPKPLEVNKEKTIQNAAMASTVILRKKKQRQSDPPTQDNNTAIENLQKQIKCIECSIKKLELNLKLTNEDDIKDDEFTNLLNKISELCGNDNGEKECETDLQEFVDEVILKRDMNSISGLIKLASFMCPILAFANKSLFSELATKGIEIVEKKTAENTVGICSKIIGYITRSGNENILTLNEIKEELGLLGEAHDNGVIEGIVGFVGIGGVNKTTEDKIAKSITSIVRRTVKNTIAATLKTATFYQKFICMVFITLLSTHIYLTLCNNDNDSKTEKLYEKYVEFVYNNMTNTTMKIGFENDTLTGGKKASKSRRAAKPRATRAAKAVSKAIAKAAAAKPKPIAKANANATKPTTKPTNATAKPKAAKAAKAVVAPKKKK
jgi:hypothetical protein